MRNVDKVNLLAEYFSLDASKGVASFIKWIKESEEYKIFLDRLNKFHYTKSLKGKKLYSYGRQIRFSSSFSMEESVVMYGKMIHFINISDEKYYLNPLIINLSSSSKMTIGELKIKFDEKILSLNDVSVVEGYTFDFKKEHVKIALEEWMKEVNEYIVEPIQKLKNQKNLFQVRNIFVPMRIVELVFALLMLCFMLIIRLANIEFFNNIYLNNYGKFLGLTYYLTFSFTIIFFVEIMLVLIYFFWDLKEYKKNFKIMSKEIDDIVVKEKNKLELYIYKQFTSNSLLEEKISSFNALSEFNAPIYYFAMKSAKNMKIRKTKLTDAENFSFSMYFALVLFFFIVLFIAIGGRG